MKLKAKDGGVQADQLYFEAKLPAGIGDHPPVIGIGDQGLDPEMLDAQGDEPAPGADRPQLETAFAAAASFG